MLNLAFFDQDELALQELAKKFAEKEIAPYAAKHDADQTFNLEALKKMGELGLLGITAPIEYGGGGLGARAATIVMEEIGKVCASTALSYLAHSILCVNNIAQNGSKEQCQKFLPKLISGEHIGCMGMSEPGFGSDALGLQTKAQLKSDGKNYLINGTKMWITNAPYADIAYVYTRTGPQKKDITTFILSKENNEFEAGNEIHKMGMRASPTGELVFDEITAPLEARVGLEGESTLHMMKNLEIERITISGISLGIAKACFERSQQYAQERRQFGQAIGSFQLIQKMLAEMATETEMMTCFLYNVAKRYDEGNKGPVAAAEVKLAIPKLATKIALDAIQLHGGYGYSQEFPLERYMRDAKLMEIGAGTNEVMITIIAKHLSRIQKG